MGDLHADKPRPATTTAALAIAGLILALAWQATLSNTEKKIAARQPADRLWGNALQYERGSATETLQAASAISSGETADEEWLDIVSAQGAASEQEGAKNAFQSPDDELLAYAGETVGIQLLGRYIALKSAGSYTKEAGETIGMSTAESMRYSPSFKRYTPESFTINKNSDYESALAYRDNLREAVAPLLENKTSEFDLFARYIETGDSAYLKEIEPIAERYSLAALRAAKISVPQDAATTHARVVNALLAFSSVLKSIGQYGADPFAGAVLVQTYNDVEREVFFAFDALASYWRRSANENNMSGKSTQTL